MTYYRIINITCHESTTVPIINEKKKGSSSPIGFTVENSEMESTLVKSNRLIEIDALRVIAIIAIVVSHIHGIIPIFQDSSTIMMIELIISVCGLSLFFFLSGYSLMIKKPEFNDFDDLKFYLARRFLRIYPLYWVYLLVTFIVYPIDIVNWTTISQQLINISGLQMFLAPQFSEPTTWFVGAIIIFYLLFPVIIFFARKITRTRTVSILMVSLTIFIALIAIRTIFNLIDFRVIIYFWFFVAGIISQAGGFDIPSIKASTVIKVVSLSGVGGLLFALILNMHIAFLNPVNQFIGIWLVGTMSIALAIQFTNSFRKYFTVWICRFIKRIAPSTYVIFLFHVYLLNIAALIVSGFDPSLAPVIAVIIGIPLAFFIPPYIGDAVDYIVFLLMKARKSKA